MSAAAQLPEQLLQGRQYARAVETCRRLILSGQGNEEVQLTLGRALAALHRNHEAREALLACVRQHPACADAFRLLGELAFRNDDYDDAVRYLKRAIELAPNDAASAILLDVVKNVAHSAQLAKGSPGPRDDGFTRRVAFPEADPPPPRVPTHRELPAPRAPSPRPPSPRLDFDRREAAPAPVRRPTTPPPAEHHSVEIDMHDTVEELARESQRAEARPSVRLDSRPPSPRRRRAFWISLTGLGAAATVFLLSGNRLALLRQGEDPPLLPASVAGTRLPAPVEPEPPPAPEEPPAPTPPPAAAAPAPAEPENPLDPRWTTDISAGVWLHPLAGPVRRMPSRRGRVFGAERQGNRPAECLSGHCGVDIGGELWGEPVLAVHSGIVERVKRGPNEEHGGMYVRLSHNGGTIFTQYFHLAAIPKDLKVGQRVKAGQVIGVLGDSGIERSKAHLHFTVSVKPTRSAKERYIDPEPLVALWPLATLGPQRTPTSLDPTVEPGVPIGPNTKKKK